MGAAHPAFHNMGLGKGFEHLAHGRELSLTAHDADRVVLADVAAGDEGQALGGGDGRDLAVLGVDGFDHVAGRRADEYQQVVHFLGQVEEDAFVLFDVMDLKAEAVVEGGGDDQASGVEGIGEHLKEREVPGAGGGLISHENDDRLGGAFHEGHFCDAWSHAAHVAGEGVRQQVLAGTVELQLLGDSGASLEHLPGQAVDFLAVHPSSVGHDELQVIAAGGHEVIEDLFLVQRLLQEVLRLFQEVIVDCGMTHQATDVGFDNA